MLTFGSLFSGIGGFDLGLERAGMKVIWQSEIDPYANAVLKKHWPDVPNHGDIRTITANRVERPDVLCGGFPCQPFSSASAGRARGESDDRFLWPEMLRLICELRPRWVIGENVAHIDRLALERVVSDMEACGYEVAPPLVIPACAVGCDHRRDRYWIVGHANRDRESRMPEYAEMAWLSGSGNVAGSVGTSYGVSGRMDANRMRCLGNAIVPQIAEIIGRAIIEVEARRTA